MIAKLSRVHAKRHADELFRCLKMCEGLSVSKCSLTCVLNVGLSHPEKFSVAFPTFFVCLHVVFLACLPCVQVPSAFLYATVLFFFFIHFFLCIHIFLRASPFSAYLAFVLVSFNVTLTELKSDLILVMIGRKISVLKRDHILVVICRKFIVVKRKSFLTWTGRKKNKGTFGVYW